jgi:hypothetical protein
MSTSSRVAVRVRIAEQSAIADGSTATCSYAEAVGARRVTVAERRARLARRHLLAPGTQVDDVAAIADALVGLHSSDPATVYLSAAARMAHPSIAAIGDALYVQHSVVRHHAMRRTLWVMTPAVARQAHAACTTGLVRAEWQRIVGLVESSGIAADGDAWLRAAKRDTLAALRRLGAAGARRIGQEVPELAKPLHMAVGKSYAASPAAHTRVLLLLGFDGDIVRGRPAGSWINGQYEWLPTESVVPGGLHGLDPVAARAALVRGVLRTFGPMTTSDLRWWLGTTATNVKRALGDVSAVQVSLDGDETGWLLPDDLDVVGSPGHWTAVLPGLDPTTMGWNGRAWYLGAHGADVFDRSGNGGPTLWVDGEIVGSWVQRRDGTIAHVLLQGVSASARRSLQRQLEAVGELYGEVRHSVRFPAPIQKALLAT